MSEAVTNARRSFSLVQRLQRVVRIRFWKMDVHPDAWISPSALIDRTWPSGVHIGEGCIFEAESVLLTHDMTRGIYMDTRIGPRSHVGVRAIIMPGVTIGSDCKILPGAIVTGDVSSGACVGGTPARPIEAA